MSFRLTNAPATFQREITRILQPLLGIQLVIDFRKHINKDDRMVGVGYIENILMEMKGSLETHHRLVSKVFHLLMDNIRCAEINKCVFNVTETSFLGCMVSRTGLRMDPEIAKPITIWPRPTMRNEVQQLLGLWNF